MATYRWKFLNQKGKSLVSAHGNIIWRLNEWQHCDGEMKACENGLHCSKKIYEAFSYVQGSVLAKVEVKGSHHDESYKSAYSDMRIVEAYKWQKKDSVALAIFSAELCLKEFEKLYPDDDRPRKAIDAARAVLAHDTVKNRAAYASSAAYAASAYAAAAAYAASAYAASAAASASASAAAYASSAYASAAAYASSASASAYAASAATYAYAASAYAAAAITKIEKWFNNHLKELEKIK